MFFLVPLPLVKHQKYETVMIIRFFENSFLSKKRHDYSFSLSAEKHKTVMIICSVMIQGAFFLFFFIKKSLLRVEYQGSRCIPDASGDSIRFTPLAGPHKIKKNGQAHTDIQKFVFLSFHV